MPACTSPCLGSPGTLRRACRKEHAGCGNRHARLAGAGQAGPRRAFLPGALEGRGSAPGSRNGDGMLNLPPPGCLRPGFACACGEMEPAGYFAVKAILAFPSGSTPKCMKGAILPPGSSLPGWTSKALAG